MKGRTKGTYGKQKMAETLKKLVSLENLTSYDTLIKKYIGDADAVVDAKSIKCGALVSDTVYFFKTDAVPTVEGGAVDTSKASFSFDISSSDVEQLLEDVEELQGTLTGYSSTNTVATAITDAKKAGTDAQAAVTTLENGQVKTNKEAIEAINNASTGILKQAKDYTDTLANGAVATNTSAIAAINNTETGILKTAKDYTDALANGQVKTNKESIEAINDTTTGILATAKGYTDTEVGKVTTTIGTVAEGETVVSMIADAKKAATDEVTRATGVEGTLTSLTTDAKTNLVAAINEVDAHADATQSDLDTLEATVGDMSAVKTTAKTVAGAVDELKDAVDTAKSAGQVYLDTAESATEGYLKTYVISQGKDAEGKKIEIGKIDIPKDLVVTSGEVVVNPEGQAAGTYIKLTIANQTNPIYINVADLVDVYTAAQSATQVQIAISDTNVVSATLVAGGVGTTELADGAVTTAKIADANVTTAKIADKNVTKAKLDDDVQTSLGKADSAIQSVATGSDNGTISVDGTDVAVKGLGSAAYTESTAYDVAGAAKTVQDDLDTYKYTVASTTEINALFADETK